MAPYDPDHTPFVVCVFDADLGRANQDGRVSVNGEPWTRFQQGRKPRPKDDGKRTPVSQVPAPPDGDDTTACLFCTSHGFTTVHIWSGSRWKCLGSAC